MTRNQNKTPLILVLGRGAPWCHLDLPLLPTASFMLVNGSAAQLERWISVQAPVASHHPATFWKCD
jgi:hypothetical protein